MQLHLDNIRENNRENTTENCRESSGLHVDNIISNIDENSREMKCFEHYSYIVTLTNINNNENNRELR